MSAVMPCDNLGAMAQRQRQDAKEASDEAMRQQIHHDERAAFMVACQDCSLKLPRSGDTVYDRVFEDLLYLDTAENWAARRALFDALLTSDKGRKWLADMAQRHARDEADSADLSDE